MRSIAAVIHDDDGNRIKLIFDGDSWRCTKRGGNAIERCSGVSFGTNVIRLGILPKEERRNLDELLYYMEQVFKS